MVLPKPTQILSKEELKVSELMVHSRADLEGLKRQELVQLMKQFKAEDTDCLQEVNGRSKKDELVEALASYMGFTDEEVEQTVKEEVNNDIEQSVEEIERILEELNVSDTAEEEYMEPPLVEQKVELENQQAEETEEAEELIEASEETEEKTSSEQNREEMLALIRGGGVPVDAPIPVVQFKGLIIGMYGDILEPLDEPTEEGFEYQSIKLERFNSRAHEAFRDNKGYTELLYTQTGSTYLVAVNNKETGKVEPVIEVTNRGRGFLRCKQIANILLLAHNQKKDYRIVSDEEYNKLISQIEYMPIKWKGLAKA